MGALICKDSGKRFKIGTGFKDSDRDAPPQIGMCVTYKYQEKTKAGLPRFPVFMRVRIAECIQPVLQLWHPRPQPGLTPDQEAGHFLTEYGAVSYPIEIHTIQFRIHFCIQYILY